MFLRSVDESGGEISPVHGGALLEAHDLIEAFTCYGGCLTVLDDVALVIGNNPKISGPCDKRSSDPLRKGIQSRNGEKINIFHQSLEPDIQMRPNASLHKINKDLLSDNGASEQGG